MGRYFTCSGQGPLKWGVPRRYLRTSLSFSVGGVGVDMELRIFQRLEIIACLCAHENAHHILDWQSWNLFV